MRILFLIFSILSFACEAQTNFNRRIDLFNSWADNAWSLVVDSNSITVAMATLTNGALNPPLRTGILKLDLFGNIVDAFFLRFRSTNVYPGGPGSLNFAGNGFILGGSFEDSLGNVDAGLFRIKLNGDTLWTKTYGDSGYQSGWMAKPSFDGGYLLCGQNNSTGLSLKGDALLIKTDSLGNLIWQKTFGDTVSSELAFSFVETPNGGYALAGQRITGAAHDIWIAITDSSGTMQWDTIIQNPVLYDDAAWNIINTSDSNLFVTGIYASEPQSSKPYYIKLDLQGQVIWTKTFLQVEGAIRSSSTRELPDGSFISAGYAEIPPHSPDYGFLIKLSPQGDSLWLREYFIGSHSKHQLRDVYPAHDGGFVACGWINPTAPDTGYQDLWILKVDSMGCELSNCTVSINKLQEKFQALKVFPVPFSSELNIYLNDGFGEGLIKIFDASGKLILEKQTLGESLRLNTSRWNDGIYLIRFSYGTEIFSRKIVKSGF